MGNYKLKQDETILFRSEAMLIHKGKKVGEHTAVPAEISLTNFNVIISTNVKALFSTKAKTQVYRVSDVKIYDGDAQIIRNKENVDIYFEGQEVYIQFEKQQQAKEFCDKAHRLISGDSKLVRVMKKTQKAIQEAGESLDIDVESIAKGTTAVVAGAVAVASTVSGVGRKAQTVGTIVQTVLNVAEKAKSLPLSERKSEDEDIKS